MVVSGSGSSIESQSNEGGGGDSSHSSVLLEE